MKKLILLSVLCLTTILGVGQVNYNAKYTTGYDYYDYSTSSKKKKNKGVTVEVYDDETSLLLDEYTSDTKCQWRIDPTNSLISYFELDFDNLIVNSREFNVIEYWSDETTSSYTCNNKGDFVFDIVFWKDKSLVAYIFDGKFLLMTGDIHF